MAHAAFELLVLPAKSFYIKIKQVNSELIERQQLKIVFNELCGVNDSGKRVKENMLERVMWAMNVLLNAAVARDVSGGQRIRTSSPGSSVSRTF